MKQEDINRLKEICEKEGFELEIPGEAFFSGKQAFTITKKDPWDGVEFAKGLVNIEGHLEKNKCFKIIKIAEKWNDGHKHVFFYRNGQENYTHTNNVTPITESEYFEQLKKEAFERFGDIKDGDRFYCSMWGWDKPAEYNRNANKWRYEKKHDMLTLDHFCLYNSGKWATKLPEKAKVIPDLYYDHLRHSEEHHVFAFEIKNLSDGYSVAEVSNFLAKQLENYLNDNQE